MTILRVMVSLHNEIRLFACTFLISWIGRPIRNEFLIKFVTAQPVLLRTILAFDDTSCLRNGFGVRNLNLKSVCENDTVG